MQDTATTAQQVISFWIGPLDTEGLASAEHQRQWWSKDAALDTTIRERFEETHIALRAGLGPDWESETRTCLAAIIVLDQFSRNMYRDTADMYTHDPIALRAATALVDAGADAGLAPHERLFVYLPLMHAEDLAAQERCVELFAGARDTLSGGAAASMQQNYDYAVRHRDIVARFGRFPHRNALVGRDSTAEEVTFLEQPGSSF